MTKVQLKNEVLNLLEAKKANEALKEALTVLLDEYTKTSKKDTVKREKVIEIDGNKYVWCNRHEVYEPLTNFKNEKSPECKLAFKHWSNLTKEVHSKGAELSKALDEERYEDAATINKELKELKEIRAGRFSFEANALQYPDIENYDYDESNFITDEDILKQA